MRDFIPCNGLGAAATAISKAVAASFALLFLFLEEVLGDVLCTSAALDLDNEPKIGFLVPFQC